MTMASRYQTFSWEEHNVLGAAVESVQVSEEFRTK